MLSCNWSKALKQIVLTLALALTVTGTVMPPPVPDQPTEQPAQTIKPQVNWGS